MAPQKTPQSPIATQTAKPTLLGAIGWTRPDTYVAGLKQQLRQTAVLLLAYAIGSMGIMKTTHFSDGRGWRNSYWGRFLRDIHHSAPMVNPTNPPISHNQNDSQEFFSVAPS